MAGTLLISDYRLVEVRGPSRGDFWPVTEKPLVIGRRADCDIVVLDPYVSRRQCEIWRSERGVELRNLSQTNPTVVNNGLMIEPVVDLRVGDRLSIGSRKFLLTNDPVSTQEQSRSGRSTPKPSKESGTTLFIQQLP